MALNTERKVFLGLLAIAGGSLVFDMAFLGEPSSVQAGAVPMHDGAAVSAPAKPVRAGGFGVVGTIGSEFKSRLEALSKPEHAPAEQITLAFFPAPEPDAAVAIVGEATDEAPVETMPRVPSLTALIPSAAGKGQAILDGVPYRVGQTTPGGFTLVRVVQRSVVLRYKDREVSVSMPIAP